MPFNPGQFVFQPRPLQNWDIGQGFRDLANARYNRQQVENEQSRQRETTAQRQDTNSLNAANFAKTRSDTEYDTAAKKYQERATLVEKARAAAQANDQATVDALIPSIIELGGTARKESDGYYLEAGQAPTRGPLDVQRARGEIYGGNGSKMGPSFQMPGLGGPGGSMFSDRNPFDSPATPGASAAAAGPLPGAPASPAVAAPSPAGPPPEEQPELLGGPPLEGAPPAAPQAEASPQNPFNPPTFSPYRVSLPAAQARNRKQLQPLLRGFNQAIPGGERRNQISALTSGIGRLGMPPEAALKLGQPLVEQAMGLMRSEDQAAATSASLGLRQQGQEFSQTQRLKDAATKRIDTISRTYKLPAAIESYENAQQALEQIDKAEGGNPDARTQAIVSVVAIKQGTRISDSDFKNASEGARNIIYKLEQGVTEGLFDTGFRPEHADTLREVVGIYQKAAERQFRNIQRQMLTRVKGNRNASPEERDTYLAAAAELIPQEYWDPMVQEFMGVEGAGVDAGVDAGAPAPPPASDNLGTRPLPPTLDGTPRAPVAPSPKVSPNGVPLVPGRIGPKPPAKPPANAPAEQKSFKEMEEEALKELEDAAGAP